MNKLLKSFILFFLFGIDFIILGVMAKKKQGKSNLSLLEMVGELRYDKSEYLAKIKIILIVLNATMYLYEFRVMLILNVSSAIFLLIQHYKKGEK